MAKSHLKLVTPTTVKRTVARRLPNKDLRTREHLTEAEVELLLAAAKGNRHGHRDATMILVAYRHGLRAAELVDLRWDQVDFRTATIHVRRVKQGIHASKIFGESEPHVGSRPDGAFDQEHLLSRLLRGSTTR
jgi:type 1 fimbriae regulatory protein FimB/type 1 fimbriae regulatory protein FimE